MSNIFRCSICKKSADLNDPHGLDGWVIGDGERICAECFDASCECKQEDEKKKVEAE
jgi:hypothetical protein